MGIRKEDDTVLKGVCMPRWVKDWFSDHKSLNCSGLVQKMLIEIIKEYDPEYYKQHEHLLKSVNRSENLPEIITII